MSARTFDIDDTALAALGADVSAACSRRLARVAGSHALALDGIELPAPEVTGVACWATMQPDAAGAWNGALRAGLDELPFGDEAFCVVLVRFADRAGVTPENQAPELARVLANHGTLLVAGLHPRSLWRDGVSPGRWERALRASGLDVATPTRCGSPWPRARGAANMSEWITRGIGGAYVIEAHRRVVNAIPLRNKSSGRRVVDHKALMPGAHRKSLHGLLRSPAPTTPLHRLPRQCA